MRGKDRAQRSNNPGFPIDQCAVAIEGQVLKLGEIEHSADL